MKGFKRYELSCQVFLLFCLHLQFLFCHAVLEVIQKKRKIRQIRKDGELSGELHLCCLFSLEFLSLFYRQKAAHTVNFKICSFILQGTLFFFTVWLQHLETSSMDAHALSLSASIRIFPRFCSSITVLEYRRIDTDTFLSLRPFKVRAEGGR